MFVGLVVVHEFGHFIVARRNGVEVEEFGIGFPPTIWRKHVKSPKGNYDFSINLLPLGGFVKLKGEHDSDKSPGSFGASRMLAKVKIMLAGVGMNLLAAFILFTVLAAIGMPKLIDNQFTVKSDTRVTKQEVLIAYVEPGSPADKAGLKQRDQILSVGLPNEPNGISSADDLPALTKRFAGKEIRILYVRSGQHEATNTTLRSEKDVNASQKTNNPKGYLGIAPTEYTLQRSTWSAPIVAAGLIKQVTILTFKGLGTVFSNLFRGNVSQATSQVAGPVGIFVLLKDGSLLGYNFILMIIAVISLTLALINALPIPALDGGRLFLTVVFRAVKRPLKQKTEEWVHGAGFVFLLILIVLITIVDIRRF